jgi:hypothetical protein
MIVIQPPRGGTDLTRFTLAVDLRYQASQRWGWQLQGTLQLASRAARPTVLSMQKEKRLLDDFF